MIAAETACRILGGLALNDLRKPCLAATGRGVAKYVVTVTYGTPVAGGQVKSADYQSPGFDFFARPLTEWKELLY